MKIVIEGMDGVGKSSVSKKIAHRLGAKYADGLMIDFFKENGMTENDIKIIKTALDVCSDNENSVIRTWIYGFANLFNMLHYETDVVIDRHCLTTYYYNADDRSMEIYKYMQKFMGKPDFVFILYADEDTRRRRICNRNPNDPDLSNKIKMKNNYDRIVEAAQYLELNYKVIYTDNKDIDTITEEIISIIQGADKNGTLLADNG